MDSPHLADNTEVGRDGKALELELSFLPVLDLPDSGHGITKPNHRLEPAPLSYIPWVSIHSKIFLCSSHVASTVLTLTHSSDRSDKPS